MPSELLSRLRREKESRMPGGIYHKVQVELTYNSNHMEGSRLTREQTRHIFETNTLQAESGGEVLRVDDIVETVNHFRCIDLAIERAEDPLSEALLKEFHALLKTGTSDAQKEWFAVGEYKKLPNEVGGHPTALPEDVGQEMQNLLAWYRGIRLVALEDILGFHVRFERIHPFQDGNGRVGRLAMFKECLAHGIVPFVIAEDLKLFYYRGLREWGRERGFLRDTCLAAQDRFRAWMDYFRIASGEGGSP